MEIRKLDEVWTADDKKLGLAQKLYHREGQSDPKLKLYGSYLEVESFDYGDDYYVPTDFIEGRDAEAGRVYLSVKLQKVLENTWSRLPDFIARGNRQEEALSEG
ncbi:MAG: hypothetical protein R3300_08525 [Candidatus Promineifilaceae bacterium]|nr:hypothetical protein [Candidatus Promineifilaceae bacterium]